MQLQSILEPVTDQLDLVDDQLRSFADKSDLPLLNELLKHVFDSTGKRTRPALTLLAAGFHPHKNSNVLTMATAVELLHVATLIHDDTVDEAETRRGRITISNAWGQHTAVLVGDYVFASSATKVCDTGNINVIRRFSETIAELSKGQLQESAYSYDVKREIGEYIQRIYYKTASLFSTSGESGAILSGAPDDVVSHLKSYSLNIGLAFQIIDDILDFEGDALIIGKPVGSDLKNGIVTLPTLYAMENTKLQDKVGHFFETPDENSIHEEIVDLIRSSNGVERSIDYASNLATQARESLTSLPINRHRNSLEELAEFIISRGK